MEPDRAFFLISRVVKKLSSCDGVAALVLAGSRVEGGTFPPDQFSDIELYVVAFDKEFGPVEREVQLIQKNFENKEVVFAYKNQWAGWSILFTDLLRLELPLAKASDDTVFTRSEEQKIEVLYAKPGFVLKQNFGKRGIENVSFRKQDIQDFWYMAVYAAQHLGRGEVWLAREAIRVSMQGKVKEMLQEIYHKNTLALEQDRRLELTWSKNELEILKETSCSYDKTDVIRAYWVNIKWAESLLAKSGNGGLLFSKYKRKLIPKIRKFLK